MNPQPTPTRLQKKIFSLSVNLSWRSFVLREKIRARLTGKSLAHPPGIHAERHSIAGTAGPLDALYVAPNSPPKAALLICHGIGEIVDHWRAAQDLLAAAGIATLVFDYSGFGASQGTVDWQQCERDAITAFEFLQSRLPGHPISVLGFSLGSGIATAILPRIQAAHLILCSAFTSFREAAFSLGLPRILAPVLPDIWNSAAQLPHCNVPVLIVHSQRDHLFPERMARELAAAAGANGELVIVPNHTHNEPFYRPQYLYWDHIIQHLKK
jgi:alpha-beta hydrolase superfamily lysophospholipase